MTEKAHHKHLIELVITHTGEADLRSCGCIKPATVAAWLRTALAQVESTTPDRIIL